MKSKEIEAKKECSIAVDYIAMKLQPSSMDEEVKHTKIKAWAKKVVDTMKVPESMYGRNSNTSSSRTRYSGSNRAMTMFDIDRSFVKFCVDTLDASTKLSMTGSSITTSSSSVSTAAAATITGVSSVSSVPGVPVSTTAI